jgi:hypothetical protein
VEAALLVSGQAGDAAPGDEPAGEGLWRVPEEAAVQVGLAAVALFIEGNRVDVHPAVARCP